MPNTVTEYVKFALMVGAAIFVLKRTPIIKDYI